MINENSPGLPPIQQPIMSMEDDDMSDQEVVRGILVLEFIAQYQ